MARFSLPVDHLNAPRPSRCKSLSFAFRRLHHRVLISVPAPFLGAYRESTTTICLLFSHSDSRLLKTFRHAIAALGIIAPHCVEFFLNAISPPLNPNRVESEASPSSFGKGRYPSPTPSSNRRYAFFLRPFKNFHQFPPRPYSYVLASSSPLRDYVRYGRGARRADIC